jgi:hypothetical protein
LVSRVLVKDEQYTNQVMIGVNDGDIVLVRKVSDDSSAALRLTCPMRDGSAQEAGAEGSHPHIQQLLGAGAHFLVSAFVFTTYLLSNVECGDLTPFVPRARQSIASIMNDEINSLASHSGTKKVLERDV